MSDHPLHVMILWHMHQPYYRNVQTGEYVMPWTQLHALKDYLDMPLLAADYPGLHVTFNMVASLLEQLQDYAQGAAADPFLDLAAKRADALTPVERVRLLQTFFMAHSERIIKPHARYHELYRRLGWQDEPGDLHRAADRFSTQDLLDLQTWFFLAWIDPYHRQRDPRLQALVDKGGYYSEQEKMQLLGICRELTGRIIPTLKDLWETGRIELATSPFFHPILPLLIDSDIARRARPGVSLPSSRFQHPEDARRQLRMGLDYCEGLFGRRPEGVWPPEGAVCPELIPMIEQAGVRWTATDEGILALSLGLEHFNRDRQGLVTEPDRLYRPYGCGHEGSETVIFFRDRMISDLIGFRYANMAPAQAAADLIGRLEQIHETLRPHPGPHVISIILDGENCWEYYEEDGLAFLSAVYKALAHHDRLVTVTPSQYLSRFGEHRQLENLASGSWISHDFSMWIGHPEKNTGWELLARARDDLEPYLRDESDGSPAPHRESVDKARKSIDIAEGSDWNWWYGGQRAGPLDDGFDALYRRHLSNAYQILGLDPPGRLRFPISSASAIGAQTPPRAFIHPVLDGRITNYFEWFSGGYYDPGRLGDAMGPGRVLIESLCHGFDAENFYLRVDFSRKLRTAWPASHLVLVVYLFAGQHYQVMCPINADNPAAETRILREAGQDGWQEAGRMTTLAVDVVGELAFPLATFNIKPDSILRFQVALAMDGREVERCPMRAPLSTTVCWSVCWRTAIFLARRM